MKNRNHTKTTLALLLAAAAATGAAPTLTAQEATAQDTTAALRAQIQELDQKLRILERKQELKEESEKASSAKAVGVTIDSKGLSIFSADKTYSIKIGTLIQTDARFFLDDSKASRDTFLLRRVRLPISASAGKYFNFFLQPEFAQADGSSGNNTQLVDAWAEVRIIPEFGIKFGKYSGPVSLETPNPRHLLESTFTNQLASNRDIGVEFSGSLFSKILDYRLGLYNGAANGSWSETANLADGDFSVGGRVTVSPFAKLDNRYVNKLAFSLGGSYGNEDGSSGRVRSSGQQDIFSSNPSYSGDHARFDAAIEWYGGPFSAIAEGIWEHWDLNNKTERDNYGWRVNAGWVITGEDSTRRGVSPAHPFSWEKGTWGAVELVARISGLKIDNDAAANLGAFNYGGGVQWYLNNNLQVRFIVEKSNFSGRGKNNNIRKNELIASTRVQLSF
jgi:phosphate-selective porin OprO/OprP